MESYFCNCLNLIINVKEKREVEGRKLVLFDFDEDDPEMLDVFFQDYLLDVVLSISGIEFAHKSLTNDRQCGDWVIYSCLNCGVETHATHAVKGLDRVLVKKSIKHGLVSLKEIKHCNSYSSIFKIKFFDDAVRDSATVRVRHILNVQVSSINSKKGKDMGKMISEVIDQKRMLEATNKINEHVKKLIQQEEEAMNERIRIYRDKQEQQLLEFKLKANKEKEEVFKTLRQYENNSSSDNLFDTMNESYFGNSTINESRDVSTELPQIPKGRPVAIRAIDAPDNQPSLAVSLPTRIYSPVKSRSLNNKTSPRKHRSYSEASDDTLFDLEGFQTSKNCEPFYESDEDSSGDATSLESSGGFNINNMSSSHLRPGDRVYATSVPVGIPLFENRAHPYEPESDPEEQEPSSPSQIAESIKALARSMNDSTSMFGELPRPRLNTTPYSLR